MYTYKLIFIIGQYDKRAQIIIGPKLSMKYTNAPIRTTKKPNPILVALFIDKSETLVMLYLSKKTNLR